MKRDASVPFDAQPSTVNASVSVLYRTPLASMTEEQRSDLYNAAGIFIERLKAFRAAERRKKDDQAEAAHAADSARSAKASAKVVAREETRAERKGAGQRRAKGRR